MFLAVKQQCLVFLLALLVRNTDGYAAKLVDTSYTGSYGDGDKCLKVIASGNQIMATTFVLDAAQSLVLTRSSDSSTLSSGGTYIAGETITVAASGAGLIQANTASLAYCNLATYGWTRALGTSATITAPSSGTLEVKAIWCSGPSSCQYNSASLTKAVSTNAPTAVPTSAPTVEPTLRPTPLPTAEPTPAPTAEPTPLPTAEPTLRPTPLPTAEPTLRPTPLPTAEPTLRPTPLPTAKPTPLPTLVPTSAPTAEPTTLPTAEPTLRPTPLPTAEPTFPPTPLPTIPPTPLPTAEPTLRPTPLPTLVPTSAPTAEPTFPPTPLPTLRPTPLPTAEPTLRPTPLPTLVPTSAPTAGPTFPPTPLPTLPPSPSPTGAPTPLPTGSPTPKPTSVPTPAPTPKPSPVPTPSPSFSRQPTQLPTELPTLTYMPTMLPTAVPTPPPSPSPTEAPEIFNITLPAGSTGLPTQGGSTVTLTGEDFGSSLRFDGADNNPSAEPLKVTYGPNGVEYDAVNCTMTVEQKEIVCVTAPGVGTNLRFMVQHTGSSSKLSAGTISYLAPIVSAVVPAYGTYSGANSVGDLTGFNTAGGEHVTLTGANFGPVGTVVEAFYRLPDAGGFDGGATLRGSRFQATRCNLTEAHTTVVCAVSAGVGEGHTWLLSAGNQTGAAPLSATTRYASPTFSSIALMGGGGGGDVLKLDTRGGANVTLVGANFGPVTSNNVVSAAYQIPDLDAAQRTELGLAGDAYSAVSCAVTVANTEVSCTSVEGVGYGHLWTMVVGDQAQHGATSATAASGSLTSAYAPALPVAWQAPSTAKQLDTEGGQVLIALGDNFGPVGAINKVTAEYSNGALSGLAAGPFHALACSVILAHTEISCTIEQGVGYDHYWNFTVGGQRMDPQAATTLATTYRPPAVTSVVADTASGLFATSGGEYALLNGFNFGPPLSSAPANAAAATYGNPALDGAGVGLIGDTYTATDCEVLSFTRARCKTVEGLGFSQRWTFAVGGQRWPAAGLNATFVGAGAVNATRAQTSYHPPTLSSLQGPNGVVSSVGRWPPVLLLAAGSEAVVLNGSNFGPAGIPSSFSVTYANPSLSDFAGSTFVPDSCSVTVAHTQITCQTVTGVGANHTWAVLVGNQSLTSDSAPAVTSYFAPQITALQVKDSSPPSKVFATDGVDSIVVAGVNFGPRFLDVPSNIVRATYTTVLPGLASSRMAAQVYEVSCTVTIRDTQVTCETLPGVGRAHGWVVSVGGQDSPLSEDRTRYSPPVVEEVEIVPSGGASSSASATTLATKGGEVVMLSGTSFGPAGNPSNAVTALYRTPASELDGLGPAVVVGSSIETTDFFALDCNVTKTDVEIRCWSAAGVGKGLRFVATVGEQVSNYSTATISYTPPAITAVDSATAVARVLHPDGITVASLQFDTTGGYQVTVTGSNFGPVDPLNSISVELSNTELGLDEALPNDGFGSTLAAEFLLVTCAVTVADEEAECSIPPAVGRMHDWTLTAGSQASPSSLKALNFTSSFTPPTLTGLSVVTDAGAGDGGFDTAGGVDVVELTGTNFGPLDANNMVYGTTLSATCERCTSTRLVHSIEGQVGLHASRTTYNFAASSCEVVDHFTLRCVVGAGVGKNHTWQAFVGGQPSNPLDDSIQTAYANPDLQKLNPVVGAVVVAAETGAVTVTLHGRYFGSSALCTPTIWMHVEEESQQQTGSGFTYTYSPVRFNVSFPLNHTDKSVAFALPELTGSQVLTDKAQTAMLSIEVAGVETPIEARVPFRYFEAQNVAPFSAPRPVDSLCVTVPNVTVYGTGFITDEEYGTTFEPFHYGAALDGKPPRAQLQLGTKLLECDVVSTKILNCPNTPGYSGSETIVDGAITLTPQVSLTGGEEWMTSCGSPVPVHLQTTYPFQPSFPESAGCTFAYYSLPGISGLSPSTGPLKGNTTVTVEGEYFEGNSGLIFAVFGVEGQAEYVECTVLSGTVATCPSPKFTGALSSLGGSLVEVQVQLDREFVERRVCLSGAGLNSSFYYHPQAPAAEGPYPPLLAQEGVVAQSLLVDATPFYDEGLLTIAKDFNPASDLLRVSSTEETVVATREEHRELEVSFSGHLDSLPLLEGESVLVEVVVDTAFELEMGTMASDCSDINLWLPDQATPLRYWLQPGTCGDADATLVARLHGPLRTWNASSAATGAYRGWTLDTGHTLKLFASFGSGVASEWMDGASVFSLSDGHSTHATGASYSDDLWRYPGAASDGGSQQQQADEYRYRAKADYGGVKSGFTQHQYKGNWSYLVMTETVQTFAPTMRVDVGWDTPLAGGGGSDYVLYFSEADSLPYVPKEDGWVGESTLFVTLNTGPSGGVTDSIGPELKVWGSDPDARVFSNGSFCGAVVDAAGPRWPELVQGIQASLSLGTDLGDAATTSLEVRYKLAGTLLDWKKANPQQNVSASLANSTSVDYGWVSCAPISGFGGRVWGAEGSDSFRFPASDGGSKAEVQEAADLAAPLSSWAFAPLPPMKLHVGVDQRSNTSNLGANAHGSDSLGWANAHTWLTVAELESASELSRPTGTVDKANREWWRMRYSSSSRPSTAQAYDLSASFNGQGGLSEDSTADLRQFTAPLSQGFIYAAPPQGGVWPEVLDLTSYDLHENKDLNLTVWSPAVSSAVAELVAAGQAASGQLSWEDLPLNLHAFADASVASPGLSVGAAAAVDIRLAVGSFEGAPCSPTFTSAVGAQGDMGAGEVAVQCSLSGARKAQLMDGTTYGQDLVRISFNGGLSYSVLPGANLTTYSVGVNFTSHLVGSMYGGTQIAGALVVEAAGASRDFMLGNSSLVLRGSSGAELVLPMDARGGEPADGFDGNGVDLMWNLNSDNSEAMKFNVTLPHSEGVFARDWSGAGPTPSPTLMNATKPPTPLPVICENPANAAAIKCPSDSVLNCTYCPSSRLREGSWYPCYRPSALSAEAGRCLPPRGAAVRFSAGESVALSVRTSLSANGQALTVGQATTSAGAGNAWASWALDLANAGGQSELYTGHSLNTYDPATLVEEMDPLGAASIRRSTDAATSITFSGSALTSSMASNLELSYSAGNVKGEFENTGTAAQLIGELAASNGYYPRVPTEFPRKSDLTVDETAESTLLLRQPTRLQSIYLASELSVAHFKAGDRLTSAYFKISGALRGNLYNVRVRLGLTNRTAVASSSIITGAAKGSALLAPVSDDELTLVCGPRALSVGDVEEKEGLLDADDAGQWVRLDFDNEVGSGGETGFVWDGSANLMVDLGYSVTPWGQGVKSATYLSLAGPAANLLLRATYGASRTAVTFGSPSNTPRLYEFVPFLQLSTDSQVVLKHEFTASFPGGVSSAALSMEVDLSVNDQPQTFLAAETSRLVPGAVMYLNVSSDPATVALIDDDASAQADLKAVVAASLASAQSTLTASNVVLVNVGLPAAPGQSSSSDASSGGRRMRRSLLASGTSASTVVEIKAVSSDGFTVSEAMASSLHKQLESSASDGTLATGLAATSSMSGKVFDTKASPVVSMVAGNSTQRGVLSGGNLGFTLFNPSTINVGSLEPALSSVDGGTIVTISGSGFFTPTTSDGFVVVRWTVLNSDVWLTSAGTVANCASAGSDCTEIVTTTPSADQSFVSGGTTKVYVVLSFNGITFTSVSFITYLTYYKSPKLNSFYMLDKYPVDIPHATQELLGAEEYRATSLMPQSGSQFDNALGREVQLYMYMNASDLYLTSSATVCVFLYGGTGDDNLDVFENCVEEDRCVLSDADLVYSDTAFEGGPGFHYITGANFYSHVEFACEVPPTPAGPVRVALSANGFSGNELAADPSGAFRQNPGLVVTSYGCSPGEYASSPNIACRACPAGKLAETDGTSCAECPRRTYQPNEGSIACEQCPTNTDTNSTGVTSASQCVCVEGYYTLGGKGGVVCDSCVGNAVCPGGRAPPYPVEGFYREVGMTTAAAAAGSTSSSSLSRRRDLLQVIEDTETVTLKLCSPPTACVGGPDNACQEGYGSNKCSECEVGFFRLSHYCTECPDPTLVSFILPVQLLMFTFALLTLALAFDTVSRYATMSIFVRFAQLLFVSSYYEVAWSGSFDHYYRHSRGVLTHVENDVYPISFFPIFKVLNYFGPLVYFPMFETTSAPGCPNDRHVDWIGVVDGFFHSSYFSLDSLGGWIIATIIFLEIVCHGRSSRILRVQQRFVAIVATCLPAAATYVVRYVICDLGSVSAGTCIANTAQSQFVLLILVGGFAFICTTFYGIASAEAGTSKANTGPWCFLTRNKKVKYSGYEAWLQMRSVLLVAITVLTNNGVFQSGLALCMLLVSLIFQVLHHPFKNTYANTLEAISTAALVVVSFVGMIGSIGELNMHIIADTLRNAGYGLVFATTILALYVIVSEVRESRSIAAKEERYARVSLGLQQPSAVELTKEKELESLVGFVREIVQAMLQGELAGNTGVRGVGACPFPDEQISQLLNSSELLYSVTMMRHTMFRSFVLSETKAFFRRIVTHPEVSQALEVAMERKNQVSLRLGPSKAELKRKAKEEAAARKAAAAAGGGTHATTFSNRGGAAFKAAAKRLASSGKKNAAHKTEVTRTTHSLRTVLFRLIDKVSRYLTIRMLEPPPVLLALKGLAAYSEWGRKTGAAKVSQQMWHRIHKLFSRRLEAFPIGVRRALHCADEETFGSHYIQPWMALLGPIAETALDTWFTVSGAGSGREVKAKMLDCMFDPEQKVAFTVETLQRLRSLLVTEPSTQHSYVVGVNKKKAKGILARLGGSSSNGGGGVGGAGGIDDLKSVKGGHIVEMRIELSNCYRDRTDPKMGQDGWSVRLLRDREMRARKVKEGKTSSAKPLVLHDDSFQATMNPGSAKNAKLFNVHAEGWSCHPANSLAAAPSMQVDLGRVTRIAALSFQGGSIYALAPLHAKPAEVPKEAVYAIKSAVDALDRQLLVVCESLYKAKPKAEQKKLKEAGEAAAAAALSAANATNAMWAESEESKSKNDEDAAVAARYWVPDSELPNGYRQAASEAKALRTAVAAMEGKAADASMQSSDTKLSQVAEESDDDDDDFDEMGELDLDEIDFGESIDQTSQESVAAQKRVAKAFKKLSKLIKFQEEALVGAKSARHAAKKMAAETLAEAGGKDKKARQIAKQISLDESGTNVAGIATIVETELGVYLPFALALLHHLRGRYDAAEDELQNSLAKLDLISLRRPAAMAGQGSDGSAAGAGGGSGGGGGLLGALGFGGKTGPKDDPTLSFDPNRGTRCDVLRAVIVQQLATAKWAEYQLRVGLNTLKAAEGVGSSKGRKAAKSIFSHDNDDIRSSLSPGFALTDGRMSLDDGRDSINFTPEGGPQDSPMLGGRASFTQYVDDEYWDSDDDFGEERVSTSGRGRNSLTPAQRASMVERQLQSAILDISSCIDAFGTAVKLNPYSYDAQTGLSVAQEELRRLRTQEEECSTVDPLLAGGDLAMRKIVMAREAAKANESGRHVLAAGPQDETLEINAAFTNPAWVTKFSVEFSKDKVAWHSTNKVDGVHDPEMVQRIYLPPPPGTNKETGETPPDPFEARYLRFKPYMDLSEKALKKRKGSGKRRGVGEGEQSWQHHVAMRIGIEELANRAADEEVVFASAGGWNEDKPEEYQVKFLRRSLGIRLSEDPIKLHGDMGACPVVSVVAEGKPWPRVGDLLVGVGSEPVRGTPLTLITAAIMEGRRPLTLRFMPRELWYAEIEEASYDLVYPVDQLGIQVAVNPETGLPTVISEPATPMHVQHSELDASKPEIEDQVVGVKKLGESTFEMLLSHSDPYQRMIDLVTTGGRPITLKYLPPMARREQVRLQKHSSALEMMALAQMGVNSPTSGGSDASGNALPGGGGGSFPPTGGPPMAPGASSGAGGGGGDKNKKKKKPVVRLERFEVTFTEPSLGLGLQCGEEEDDLPIVSSAPAGLPRPAVGDVMETVGGVKLIGSGDAYSKSIELITGGGRPLTIGFVALPTTTYDLAFDAPRLGISLQDRDTEVPVVEANNSGRTQPTRGDRLVAINGEKLGGKTDPYQWAVNKIKNGGRPLNLTFETAMEGAQAAAVLKALARKELAASKGKAAGGKAAGGKAAAAGGGGMGAPAEAIHDRSRSSTPVTSKSSAMHSRKVSMDEEIASRCATPSQDRPPPHSSPLHSSPVLSNPMGFFTHDEEEEGGGGGAFGAPSEVVLDASDEEEGGEGGGGALGALWSAREAAEAALGASTTRTPVSTFEAAPYDDDVHGGAPASEIADADAEYKEVVFRGAKLGLDLLGGATTGHLPVLGSPLQAESTTAKGARGGGGLFNRSAAKKGESVMLEAGDQVVGVGGTSLIDAEDPFERAVQLIKAHTERPLTIRFMAASTPGPFSVKFENENLGIAIEANASDPQGFPVVWNNDDTGAGGGGGGGGSSQFPRVGDSVVGVGGHALGHPTDKLAEAANLIRGSPRPLRVLFQPAFDHASAHAAVVAAQAQQAAEEQAAGAAGGGGSSGNGRVYTLSFPHKSLGIALLDEGAGDAPVVESVSADGGASPQGPLRMPLPGHKLLAVNGQPLMGPGTTNNSNAEHPYDVAVSLIKSAPRPVKLSFQPPEVYALEFPEQRLGISLEDTSATHGLPSILAGGCAVSPSLPLTGDVVAKVADTEIDPSHPSESTYDQAVRLITSSPRPVTIVFAAPPTTAVAVPPPPPGASISLDEIAASGGEVPSERFEVVFEAERLGMGLQAGEEAADLPVVSSSPPGRQRPSPGDHLESVNGAMLLGAADPYATAIDLITSAGRPLVLGFVAFSPPAAAVVTMPPPPPPQQQQQPKVLAITSMPESPTPAADGSYEVVFEGERLGMGLQSPEIPTDFPSVSSQPAGKDLPKEGHLIVSVNGYNLQGSSDTYAKAVELITTAGRPVIIGFRPPLPPAFPPPLPAADASVGPYETVFRNGKLGMGLSSGERPTDLPCVSSSPQDLSPGERVPLVGDLLRSVNGETLAGAPDAYEKAVELITSVGRPVTLGFLPAPALPTAMAPGSGYEVVFEGERLGMGLQSPEIPTDFPSVSSPPAGKELPMEGHLIVSVNGYNLQGASDTYAKAVELITTAGRPVIIGFRVPDTSNANTPSGRPGDAGDALLALGGGLQGMETLDPAQRVHALFDLLDANKDGVLTKAEVIGGAPQLKMSLFDAANLFDQLDVNNDGVLERAEFVSMVPEAKAAELKKLPKAKRKTLAAAPALGPLPQGLLSVLGVNASDQEAANAAAAVAASLAEEEARQAAAAAAAAAMAHKPRGPRSRPQFKASDVVLKDDGSYTVTFRGGKGKGPLAMPPLGFKLAEAPKRAMAPRVDLTGYQDVSAVEHTNASNGKANAKLTGWPLLGHQVVAVEGSPVELDGVQDCFARCVKLLEDACHGSTSKSLSPVGCVVITFRPPPQGETAAQAASQFLDEDQDAEGGGGDGAGGDKKQQLNLRPGLADDEASDNEEVDGDDASLWADEGSGFGAPPMEVELENGMYAVQFTTGALHMKLMENVDRRQLPVVAKAFPGASLMQRGHLLLSVNGKPVDDKRSQKHEPFTSALDFLAALRSPPVTLEFARPPPVAKITAVEGSPGLYDAVFEGENLGIDLASFGRQGRVVRISGTHPIGVPHLGDQVVGVNGVGLLGLAERIEAGKLLPSDGKKTKDVLSFVQRVIGDKLARPVTLRMQRSTGEMAAGEEMAEARRGFSVLFMSASLGLGFDLKTGVPVVDDVRPVFTAPRQGDVLTAINGAELSKCALTVGQLALMLRALPRPLKLSFVDGSKALQDALKSTSARGEGSLKYPEHHLRQVLVPSGRRVGLKLMTISHRPVVQAVLSKALADQGMLPCDVLVTIDGKHVGDVSAVECAKMLADARKAADDETAKASRASRVKRTRAIKLGVLRMAPLDRNSSYNSQHPIDVAAALTTYDNASKIGLLSFSMPHNIPNDKYKVEVYRFGSQVAPMMSGGSHERDHYVRYTRSVGVDLQQTGGRFAAEKT